MTEPTPSAAPPRCDTCRWFDPDYIRDLAEYGVDDAGLCNYPRTRLPLSEQGVPSERRSVSPNEENCPTHEVSAGE